MAVGDAEEKQRGWNLGAMLCSAMAAGWLVSVLHEGRVRFAWDLTGTDLVTALMAGAGLILTAVGIFVAILAFFGWGTIRRDSLAVASKQAKRELIRFTASDDFGRQVQASFSKFTNSEKFGNMIESSVIDFTASSEFDEMISKNLSEYTASKAFEQKIEDLALSFLEKNWGRPELTALLNESALKRQGMTEFDADAVDEGWAELESDDDDD